MTRLFLIISLAFVVNVTNANTTKSNQQQADTVLVNIQTKIYNTFGICFSSQSIKPLTDLDKQLETLNQGNSQNLITYWRGYLHYYSAIFYLKQGDRKLSEKEIDKGIDLITNINNKNSEDYALLSLLQGFAIQFKGMGAMSLSPKIKVNAKKAIAMDSNNIRGYYVYASNDFYTPSKYGGGKESEKYLLKAISIKPVSVSNPYLPTWGKEAAYQMLISLYLKQNKKEKAKKYYNQAVEQFPNSYSFKHFSFDD